MDQVQIKGLISWTDMNLPSAPGGAYPGRAVDEFDPGAIFYTNHA